MGLDDENTGGSVVSLSTQVEGTIAAEKAERISDLLESLSVIFEKIKDFYAVEGAERQQIAVEIDQMVSELIYAVDAGQFSLFTEEERSRLEALKDRKINEITDYIGNLVDLYSLIETREDVIGLMDIQKGDRFSLQRAFLVKFLAAIQRFTDDQSAESLIKIRALVKIYERMQIEESIEQEAVIMHCKRFTAFFNSNLMACLRRDESVRIAVLDEISNGADSLLASLKPVARA